MVLKSCKEAQKENCFQNVPVQLGTHSKSVNIKCPCGMIIGDMQGGDKMCCSSVNYSCTLEHICCACNVCGDQTGNPDVKCKKMNTHKIHQWVLEGHVDELNAICQKNTYSAWFDVDFGGCKRGVFEAAMPVEALHALEGGMFKQVMEIFITEDLKEVFCKRLDVIIKTCANGRSSIISHLVPTKKCLV